MKQLLSATLMLLLACATLAAQNASTKQSAATSQNPATAGMETLGAVGQTSYLWENGNVWMSLTDDAKIALVIGIEQGIVLSVRENWNAVPKAAQPVLAETAGRLTVGKSTFTQLAVTIDALYLQQANLGIPIVDAYQYALLELKNTPPDKLQHFLDEVRQNYHLPTPPPLPPEKKH